MNNHKALKPKDQGYSNKGSPGHFNMTKYMIKSHIWPHHVEELVEMNEMDFCFTKLGDRTQKLRFTEDRDTGRVEIGEREGSAELNIGQMTQHQAQ